MMFTLRQSVKQITRTARPFSRGIFKAGLPIESAQEADFLKPLLRPKEVFASFQVSESDAKQGRVDESRTRVYADEFFATKFGKSNFAAKFKERMVYGKTYNTFLAANNAAAVNREIEGELSGRLNEIGQNIPSFAGKIALIELDDMHLLQKDIEGGKFTDAKAIVLTSKGQGDVKAVKALFNKSQEELEAMDPEVRERYEQVKNIPTVINSDFEAKEPSAGLSRLALTEDRGAILSTNRHAKKVENERLIVQMRTL
jgi:hypothetical protein